MKKCVLSFLLLVLVLFIGAKSLDEAISYVVDTGGFVDHSGTKYFISSTIMSEDELPDESAARQYVAQTAFVFNVVRQNWGDYTSGSVTSSIKQCSKVACPYTNGYQDFLLELSMSDTGNLITQSEYEEKGDASFWDFTSRMRSKERSRNLSFWFDEF